MVDSKLSNKNHEGKDKDRGTPEVGGVSGDTEMNAVGKEGVKGEVWEGGKTTVGRRSVAMGRKVEVYTSKDGERSQSLKDNRPPGGRVNGVRS